MPKTAVVIVDVYNQFLYPTCELNGLVSESLATSNAIIHLKELVSAARRYHLPILYTLHQTPYEENCEGWQHTDATGLQDTSSMTVEDGRWGTEIFGSLEPGVLEEYDLLVCGYSNKSDSAKARLDRRLQQREITHILIGGMVVGSCVEAAGRYSWELGYHITLL
ncbi:isochorismatase hydrolase [Stagonosporopsis vannaccii]|nr:isochorismatase hydrolase [Stagonosporopsis vannaccii]